MSDYRANIKIEFTMFKKTFKTEFDWINYSPDENGIDYRIAEWFCEKWEYFKELSEMTIAEAQKKLNEEKEYEEYLKLKAKFKDKEV